MNVRKILAPMIFLMLIGAQSLFGALVVEYTFDGNANDSSGNGEDLTLMNGATLAPGVSGDALTLDGVDDYAFVNIGNYALTNFTVECWVNVPTYDDNVHYVSLFQNRYVVLGDYDSGPISTWADGLNPIDAGPVGTTPTTNEWHHFAFTFDGTNQYIYIDGVLEKTVPTTGALSTTGDVGLAIGARYTGGSQYVQGAIDNVRIYDEALAAGQLGFYTDANNTMDTQVSVPLSASSKALLALLFSMAAVLMFSLRKKQIVSK